MLIIFDLDDTLIDTSLYITPVKLRKALLRMQQEGCPIPSIEQAYESLQELNRTSISSGAAIEEFLCKNAIEQKWACYGKEELYDVFPDPDTVKPAPGAVEVIQELSKIGQLAIVSIGMQRQQLFKLEQSGICASYFYKIFILEEKNKKKYYQRLIEGMEISPREVVVCGDRVEVDLRPAKEIGCHTVHMQRGRGKIQMDLLTKEVDFSIVELKQLVDICSKLKKR